MGRGAAAEEADEPPAEGAEEPAEGAGEPEEVEGPDEVSSDASGLPYDIDAERDDPEEWLVEKEWEDAVDEMEEVMESIKVNIVTAEKEEFEEIATGRIVGSRTICHVGTRREAISVYCRLHQCKTPMKRTHQAPTVLQVKAWFSAGLDLERGAPGRAEHLGRLWRDHCSRLGEH
jgi:hypothetical protein